MRKAKLSRRDAEICQRLREAREKELGITQAECAKQTGLERTTLVNYELGRTPVRYEVALQFCRQFIISEEWLATGAFEACHAVARAKGISSAIGAKDLERGVYLRQCVDLLSDPACLHIPRGTLFSVAYDERLATRYSSLVARSWLLPLIRLTEADKPELALNYLTAVNERFCLLLSNEALRRGRRESDAWRVYTRCVLEAAQLVFRRMMRLQISAQQLAPFKWMAEVATVPDAEIHFLREQVDGEAEESPNNNLPDAEIEAMSVSVKARLPNLLERLREATTESGSKSALAEFLGVPLASVSRWLSGEREPGGEYVLQMLQWVEQQERKSK